MSEGTNSLTAKRKAAQNAAKQHRWPELAGNCSAETLQIFLMNLTFRAYDDWTAPEIFEVARLSRTQADAVELANQIDISGYVSFGGKLGLTPIENPKVKILHSLNSSITVALRRLGVTASNSGGDRVAKSNRATLERETREDLATGDAEDEFDRSQLM